MAWNEIKMPSSGGDILKWQNGKSYRLRIIDEPYVYSSDFNGKPSTRFAMLAWNETDKMANIIMLPPGAFGEILGYANNEEDWGNPEDYDFVISKTGVGLETRYAIQPSPKRNKLAEEKLEAVRKINLADVLDRLPTVTFYAKASDVEGTHAQKEQIKGPQTETVEDVPDRPITAEDIPF